MTARFTLPTPTFAALLLGLGLMAAPAFAGDEAGVDPGAGDPPTDVQIDDPIVDSGEVPGEVPGDGVEVTSDGEAVDYDPVIAQSGVPMPNERANVPGLSKPDMTNFASSRQSDQAGSVWKKHKGAARTLFGSNSPWADWQKARKAD